MMKKESRERKFSAFLFLFSIKIITFAGDLARTVKLRRTEYRKACRCFIKKQPKWTIITRRTITNCKAWRFSNRKPTRRAQPNAHLHTQTFYYLEISKQ